MNKRIIVGIAGAATAVAIVGSTAACGTTKTVNTITPGPTVTQTVPAPTITQTVTASPPPPATGSKLLDFSGTGTEETPSFNAGGSGDYTVSWTFSGNDQQGDGGDNFIMSEDGGNDVNALSLPNVIQTDGSGNTGVTNDPGAHTFNVQADDGSSWTVEVVSAP